MVDRKSSQTKTFSQNIIYMFCLYNFSVKCIIKKNYLSENNDCIIELIKFTNRLELYNIR